MHALFDTGSNVTLLNKKLVYQLGLNMVVYTSTFWEAAGASVRFVGRLPRTKLLLHDSLNVIVESI